MTNLADPSIGWGCVFKLEDQPNGNLLSLIGVYDMQPPSDTADRVEVTHYASPQRRKQYISGLRETSDVTISMNYAPGSPTDGICHTAVGDSLSRKFEMDIPDATGGTWRISGHCTARTYERNIPNGDRKTAKLTIAIDGGIDEATAS